MKAPTTTATKGTVKHLTPTATAAEAAFIAAADLSAALDYLDSVLLLLDWAPSSLVPGRAQLRVRRRARR